MGPTTADIQELAEKLYGELCGTCDSMPEWVEEHEQEAEIYSASDELMFCCGDCGWWCDASEANECPDGGEDICDDCLRDR